MAISNYNQQALAAGTLIQGAFRQQITYVKGELPKEDIVLEIGVERESALGKVHEVATLHMDYSNQATIKLKICVHKEEQIKIRDVRDSADKELVAESSSRSLALTNQPSSLALASGGRNMQLAAPTHFQMMNQTEIENYRVNPCVDGYGRCPNAMKVLEVFNTLFPNGIPVPGAQPNEKIHFHFRIIVHVPATNKLETLYKETKTGSSGISNVDISNHGATQYTYTELLKMHQHMAQVAAGLAMPRSLEQTGNITQQGGSFLIADGKKSEQKTIA